VSFLIAAAVLKTPTRNGYNAKGVNLNSRASVLETLLTAQTRLVLPTAIHIHIHTADRRERSTQTDRHKNIDASKWRLETEQGGVWLQTYRGHCLRKGIACAQAET